ncbi:NUDIX domain-containing protein [Streptomyces sp. NPDC088915]|uniref:NUDIX domain-containing protein n=1 Tax=Streptomyces sp. NPDC088915 TaxID=3365912 RepID=UPI003801B1E8
MPPSHARIRGLLSDYLGHHPGERDALAGLSAALDATTDATDRSTLPGHVTCSGVVLDADGRVLHIRHRATRLLLPPGGHVEAGDDTLLGAALREVEEETGIPPSDLVLVPEFGRAPIDIDVHTIDADPVKGEPAHEHYDFRFVFRLAGSPALTLRQEEVTGFAWLPQDEVGPQTLRAKLRAAALDGAVTPVNASAVIHDGHGRYLLHLRDANKPEIWAPGCWDVLGGGREPGDTTLRDTIVRELREEAGLEPDDLEPYRVEHVIGTDGTRVPIQLFTGRWNGDPSTLTLTEGQLLAWIRPDQLPRLTMLPTTRELIERHAAAHPTPAAGVGVGVGAGERTAGPAAASIPSGTVPHVVGVHLHLERDGKVLLGLRHPDSAYAGRTWHALAGHLEAEAATAGLAREAYEEAGLVIDPADLELVHTVHTVDRPGARPRMQLFFRPRHWEGVPEVREPDRCLGWDWFSAKDLPEPIVPYTRLAIEGVRAGRSYSELGWPG